MLGLTHALHHAALHHPKRIATVYENRRRTYAQLKGRVERLAGGLSALGVSLGDRVVVIGNNSDFFLEATLAVYWAGAVICPLNTRWSAEEVRFALHDSGAKAVIYDEAFSSLVEQASSQLTGQPLQIVLDQPSSVSGLSVEALATSSSPLKDVGRSGDDLAGIFYTGGTTGIPKGVMLSHQGMLLNAVYALAEGAVGLGKTILHVAPMFHLADGFFVNVGIAGAATHVIAPGFSVESLQAFVQEESVEEVLLVPTMIQLLLDDPRFDARTLHSLRRVVYGSAPIAEVLLDRMTEVLPNVRFTQMYGMTELSPVATILHPQWHDKERRAQGKHRSAGQAMGSVDLKIVSPDGDQCPPGTHGEVCVRGPGVMLGYWNQPSATRQVIRDGWMHTGDGGYIDSDGFLFLTDRLKDMIITGGENVYSVEVEHVLRQHPSVIACAVVGRKNKVWGELVCAFVVLREATSVDSEALLSFCRERLSHYKCPREMHFVEGLPLSAAGKVLKNKLRELLNT